MTQFRDSKDLLRVIISNSFIFEKYWNFYSFFATMYYANNFRYCLYAKLQSKYWFSVWKHHFLNYTLRANTYHTGIASSRIFKQVKATQLSFKTVLLSVGCIVLRISPMLYIMSECFCNWLLLLIFLKHCIL